MKLHARAPGPTGRRPAERPVPEPALLRLQRLAGNRAVRSLLDGQPPPTVQRRRLPVANTVEPLVAGNAVHRDEHAAGLERVNARVMRSLTPERQEDVILTLTAHPGYGGMSRAEQANFHAQVLRWYGTGVRRFGNPALIAAQPRDDVEWEHTRRLVNVVSGMMTLIIGGGRNRDLEEVFGTDHVAAARDRYRNAKDRLLELAEKNAIVTDRSRYTTEADIGGRGTATRIWLSPRITDYPDDPEAAVTLLHEAMHAGNADITDHAYPDATWFTTLDERSKLTNAAHYEVVPRRVRNMRYAFPKETFHPYQAPADGGTGPGIPDSTMAASKACQLLQQAWDGAMRLHEVLVRVHLNPGDWTGLDLSAHYSGASGTFAGCLPYWSKVIQLTVHQRTGAALDARTPDVAPVTAVDLALSEGVGHLLATAKNQANKDLARTDTMLALADRYRLANDNVPGGVRPLAYYLLLLVCRKLGEITGSPRRDQLVIRTLAEATTPGSWSTMLTPRHSGAFQD